MIKRWIFIAALSLAIVSQAQAAGVRAMIDRNQVQMGESVRLRVILEGGQGEPDLSALSDFTALSQGATNSFQMINGRTSRQQIHNYALIPKRTGSLTIPALAVTIDGTIHRSDPIAIIVSKQPPVASGQRDVHVTASVSNERPWVGEQITYTFRLFNAVSIAEPKFQAPAFDGFSAQQLDEQPSRRTMINGREFNVTELHVLLTPLAAGTVTIEPAVLQVGLLKASRQRRRPFGGMDAFFGRQEMVTRRLQTEALTLQVQPLPTPPPDANFSGLVGEFSIEAKLETNRLAVGDSTTLAIVIRGRGNLMDATAPKLTIPNGFKRYADNPEEQIQTGTEGVSGSKTFRTALVPVQPGAYTIGPIGLTYFDIERGAYRTVTNPAFRVTVDAAAGQTNDLEILRSAPSSQPSMQQQVEFTGRDILPLKEELAAIESRRPLSAGWFGLLLALPALAFGVIQLFLRKRYQKQSPGQIMADRAREALKQASVSESNQADFLSSLYRALVSAIVGIDGRMATSLTWSEAETLLKKAGWEESEAADAARLLESIESFNYSGETLDAARRADLLERTRDVAGRLAP